MPQQQVPGFTKSGAYWYRDADGFGPFGIDVDGSPFLIGGGNTGSPVDRSGTIVTGGQPVIAAQANPVRRGFFFQNTSTGPLGLNELGASATLNEPSIVVAAGASYQSPAGACSTAAISVIGATTGQGFAMREW